MIYIATNKDNKDALMHYGVKGMRWGKRGGRFKWPWDRDDDSNNSNKNRGKSKYGTAYFQRGIVALASARDEIGRLRGASGVARQRNLYPDTATRRSPGSNISTSARPQQNKLSTSQKTYSTSDKRYKQYLKDKAERRKVAERKGQYQLEQQRLADREDVRKRQQNWKNMRFKTKEFHTMLTGNSYYGKKYSIKDPGTDMWEREHAGEKNPFRSDRLYSHNYYEARKSKIRRR